MSLSKSHLKGWIYALLLGVSIASCNKDDNPPGGNGGGGTAEVNFHLTDGPGNYEAVLLDIQRIEVIMNNAPTPVVLTPIVPGVYDLLQFSNGLDTLLVNATLPAGTISQIRLVLGNDNNVVVDGQTYPLTTPSGQTSGVKLNLHQTLTAGATYDIWLDFDAAKSIVLTGNGKYILKPVIRAYSALTDGRLKGYVLPAMALPVVYAANGADTFAAIPAPDGYFALHGLPAATYQVWIDADNPLYLDTLLPPQTITFGMETDLGIITLQQ